MRFHHISYRVTLLEEENNFLRNIFDVNILHSFCNANGEAYGYMLELDGAVILEIFQTSEKCSFGFNHIAFLADDLSTLRQRLQSLGYKPSGISIGKTDRIPQFFIKSPNDIPFEFHQSIG